MVAVSTTLPGPLFDRLGRGRRGCLSAGQHRQGLCRWPWAKPPPMATGGAGPRRWLTRSAVVPVVATGAPGGGLIGPEHMRDVF